MRKKNRISNEKRPSPGVFVLRLRFRCAAYNICVERIPLSVIELCDENGEITPLYVVKDGKRFAVERVMRRSRHAPPVACVSPTRFDCMIDGRKKIIYRDAFPSLKWFSVR